MVHDTNRDQRLAGISAANRENDLQIVPAPPGFEYDYHFFPGANAYGVIDAGYECPKCKTPVNGMGTKRGRLPGTLCRYGFFSPINRHGNDVTAPACASSRCERSPR